MIDIHSHILWGLDDGAATRDESVAMLHLAAEAGTTDIVATPHANYRYPFQPALIRQRADELSALVSQPRIHLGCDFHLSFENVQDALADRSKYLINRGPYLLVEFPDAPLNGMDRVLHTLLSRRLIPIITHPERHHDLKRIGPEFLDWVHRGCLVQVTAQSLLGRFGKSAEESAWEMLRRGIAHFIASDAHGVQDRTPRLDAAFEAVASRLGEPLARELTIDNPGAVLAGRPIEVHLPKRRPWYRLTG